MKNNKMEQNRKVTLNVISIILLLNSFINELHVLMTGVLLRCLFPSNATNYRLIDDLDAALHYYKYETLFTK